MKILRLATLNSVLPTVYYGERREVSEEWRSDLMQTVRNLHCKWSDRTKFVQALLGFAYIGEDAEEGLLRRHIPEVHPWFTGTNDRPAMFAMEAEMVGGAGIHLDSGLHFTGTPDAVVHFDGDAVAADETGLVDDASNSMPIEITTAVDHGLDTGDRVRIEGVIGNEAANGNWIITVTGDDTFTLDGSDGTEADEYEGGGVYYADAEGLAHFRVTYRAVDWVIASDAYIDAEGEGRTELDRFVTKLIVPAQQNLAYGLGSFKWASDGDVFPEAFSIPVPTAEITLIWREVAIRVDANGVEYPLANILPLVGMVNSDVFLGRGPETLLLLPPEPKPGLSRAQGVRQHDTLTIKMLYRPNRVSGDITDATFDTPITITTSAEHGLPTGALVAIRGVTGCEAANGTWVITVLSDFTFSLDGSVGDNLYTGGGVWESDLGHNYFWRKRAPDSGRFVRLLRNDASGKSVFELGDFSRIFQHLP